MIEGASILVWWRRAIRIRYENIPALHVIAREDDLCHRNLRLDVDYLHLSCVQILHAHGTHQLLLPLEPWHVRGIFVRTHNGEPVADAYTLVLAPINMHVVAAREDDLVIRLLPRDEPDFVRDSLVRNKS